MDSDELSGVESVVSAASISKISSSRRGRKATVKTGFATAKTDLARTQMREYEEQLDREEEQLAELDKRLSADRRARGVVLPAVIEPAGPSKRRPTSGQSTVDSAALDEMDSEMATRVDIPFIASSSDPMTADEIHEVGLKCAFAVKEVSRKSGNLRGTCQRTLNNASMTIRRCLANLASRTSSDESRRVEEANRRLREEVHALRREVASLRTAVDQVGTGLSSSRERPATTKTSSDQVLLKALTEMRRTMEASNASINARLDGLEMGQAAPVRALSLRGRPATPARSSSVQGEERLSLPRVEVRQVPFPLGLPPVSEWTTETRGKRKKRGKGRVPNAATTSSRPLTVTAQASAQARPAVPSIRSAPQVAASEAPGRKKRNRTRGKKVRLRPPTTAAVVVKLRPEALEMGVTYADTIKRARQAISLPDLGIEGVRSRTAATGARLIEVSGSESGTKADQLAKRLELVLSDVATIARPEKYAETRVSGLDSSLSTDDVAAELAARAGCSVEDLRVGRIRAGPNQAGSTIVRCPMRVAKALVEAGRFLLGWDFAQVVALEPRPMRCYRCMGVGHTRQRCPSAVDRTGLCFRCGLPGHQARGCSKEPRCAVCAVAKKPHAHIMGGRGCSPPAVRARPVPPEQKGTTAQRMPAEVEPSVELPLDRTEEMETVEEPPPSPKVPTTDHPNVSLSRDTGSEGGRVVEVEDPGEGPSRSTTPAWERPRAPDGRFSKAAVKPTPKTGPPTSGGPR